MYIKCDMLVEITNISLLTCLLCLTTCVCVLVLQSKTGKKNKCWKPSKPEGVISLSTWIFDWRKIKIVWRETPKIKEGKPVTIEPGRRGRPERTDGKKKGNNSRHFNGNTEIYLGLVSMQSVWYYACLQRGSRNSKMFSEENKSDDSLFL